MCAPHQKYTDFYCDINVIEASVKYDHVFLVSETKQQYYYSVSRVYECITQYLHRLTQGPPRLGLIQLHRNINIKRRTALLYTEAKVVVRNTKDTFSPPVSFLFSHFKAKTARCILFWPLCNPLLSPGPSDRWGPKWSQTWQLLKRPIRPRRSPAGWGPRCARTRHGLLWRGVTLLEGV